MTTPLSEVVVGGTVTWFDTRPTTSAKERGAEVARLSIASPHLLFSSSHGLFRLFSLPFQTTRLKLRVTSLKSQNGAYKFFSRFGGGGGGGGGSHSLK